MSCEHCVLFSASLKRLKMSTAANIRQDNDACKHYTGAVCCGQEAADSCTGQGEVSGGACGYLETINIPLFAVEATLPSVRGID